MKHYTKKTIMEIMNQTFPENPPKESDMFIGKKELSMAGFTIFQTLIGKNGVPCMQIGLSIDEYLRAPFIREFLDANDNLVDSYFIGNQIQSVLQRWWARTEMITIFLFGNIADTEIFVNAEVLKDILLEDYRKFIEENKGDLK